MSETATETAKTQTEAESSSQAAATTETATTLIGTATDMQAASETKQETSTETKTEAAKTEEKTETKTETKTDGAPGKYEFKDAEKFDSKVLEAFTESAKEANLSQDAAQKLLDKVAPALAMRQDEQVKSIHQGWIEASKVDKEFGGDKLNENLGIAKKALDQFSSPELRTLVEATGLGNNPEFIRAWFKVGKAMSEDGFVSGSPSGKSEVNAANVLYDKTTAKD